MCPKDSSGSEERPRLALQGFNVGVWEYNYATGESHFSERWKAMLGYEGHEIADRRNEWLDRVHPDDQETVRVALEAHLRGERPYYETEHRVRCKDGTHKWVLSRGKAVFDASGRPSRIVGAHADISERKKAEVALMESEERYRRLFEDNPTPMYVYDRETKEFLAVNKAAVSHYGYSRGEFAKMTIHAILPPAEAERLRGADGEDLPIEMERCVKEHRRKDGSTVFMEIAAHDHEFGGRPAVLAMATDVTQRHFAENSYRELFENAVEGIFETTPEGRFISVNPACARMLGYADPQALLEANISVQKDVYTQPDRRDQFFTLLGKSDEMQDFESEVRRRDGGIIWISENVRAMRDSEGKLVRFQSFVSDVTARRNAAEALRQGEQRLKHIVQQADCMLWQARVADIQGVLHWDCHVPSSGLYLRLFERERYDGKSMFWTPEMAPDLEEMERRSLLALRGGDHEYHQEFRVLLHNQTVWLSEK
ncbi:MAG: PAS domain S-box protein, partial [Opitutaceae bacterium]